MVVRWMAPCPDGRRRRGGMLGALSPVPRGGARLAAVCRGSRRRRVSSSAGERWQLGTLTLEVACTPCVVTAPWGAARKGAAFAPSRPAAGSAFAEACRALLNPANPSLAGTARPYFPRGGPLPPPPPAGLETSSRGWGGIDAGEGMLYPAQVVDGLVHAHAGGRLRTALAQVEAGEANPNPNPNPKPNPSPNPKPKPNQMVELTNAQPGLEPVSARF